MVQHTDTGRTRRWRAAAALVAILAVAAGALVLFLRSRAPGVLPPGSPKAAVVADIDAYLHAIEKDGFTGVVLLVDHDESLLRAGYGFADRASQRPNTPETGFDIGSITKVFTEAAIQKLASQGRLRLDDRLSKYFPDAPAATAAITVDQLVEHRAGLPDFVDASLRVYSGDDYEPVSRDEIVRRALHAPLRSVPGTEYAYSNLGYSILGVIIELVTARPYESFVHDALFARVGMERSGYLAPRWQKADLAVGYEHGKTWGTPLDHPWLADGPSWNLRANGGMLSTVDELHAWVRGLESGAALDETARRGLFATLVRPNARGERTMGPAGGNDVFNAAYLWYVDGHRLLVVMTNDDAVPAERVVPILAKKLRSLAP